MGLDLDNVFSYHPPVGSQKERYVALRDGGKLLLLNVRECDRLFARRWRIVLHELCEAVMWANAAIAINEQEAV